MTHWLSLTGTHRRHQSWRMENSRLKAHLRYRLTDRALCGLQLPTALPAPGDLPECIRCAAVAARYDASGREWRA
jgi:hypothetical protein